MQNKSHLCHPSCAGSESWCASYFSFMPWQMQSSTCMNTYAVSALERGRMVHVCCVDLSVTYLRMRVVSYSLVARYEAPKASAIVTCTAGSSLSWKQRGGQ